MLRLWRLPKRFSSQFKLTKAKAEAAAGEEGASPAAAAAPAETAGSADAPESK